ICNSIEHFLLCQRTIICDIVDMARSILMIGCKQETLHHIGYIAKWQSIISSPNNNSLALLYTLGHATKMQAISRTKESTRANDNSLHYTVFHKASYQLITFSFSNAVGIRVRAKCIFFC